MMQLFKQKIVGKEVEKEEVKFQVISEQKIAQIPEIDDKTKVDLRYGLIIPYAYVHIYWDEGHGELVYYVEEPSLDDKEKETLNVLEEGIREFINMSFINVSEKGTLIEYLEKNVKVLLKELGIKLDKNSYLKIMYYIYRDFIGLNRIEPLMNDYYIEDIECNGKNTPVYIVHRKFGNLRTNIIYEDFDELKDFVAKLSQKCGRYISYGSPMVDGQLPSGDRVNATYTEDVTSRGPTFTLRKFTRVPWSPIKLMEMGTVSAELLAYLWLLIEHGSNILIVGGTGSGKTTLLNNIAFFIPDQARIVSIEDSVTGDAKIILKDKSRIRVERIGKIIDEIEEKNLRPDFQILTCDKNYKLKFVKPKSYIRHKVNKDVYKIQTSTGREIKVTEDHSLFTLGDYGLLEVKPRGLTAGKNFIAVPRKLPIEKSEIKVVNLMDYLGIFKEDYLIGEPLIKLFKRYKRKDFGVGKSCYQWWKEHNLIKIDKLLKVKFKFSNEEIKKLEIKSKTSTRLPILFTIDDYLLKFIGLWLGDGSYDNYNANRVIISNNDEECIDLVYKVARNLHLNISKMNDRVSLTLNSVLFYKFMKYCLKLDGYSNTKKVPDFVFNLSNRQLREFLKGYFSADGTVKIYEVGCSSQSTELLNDLQTIFLRLGIIARINHGFRKDKCKELFISSYENINKFKQIGFLQERKNRKLENLGLIKATHATLDIIPLNIDHKEVLSLPWCYFNGSHIGREHLQRIAPMGSIFNDLSHSDILWDKVVKVKKLKRRERYVYDISVPETEKFVCSNIIVHNTRELQLIHENWLPSVARAGVGLGEGGVKPGEVTMFDLLKGSFRQRPDYVIVGEVRGAEASVLMQGAAAGHPSISTMHADDVATVIRRLMTPPISLSPALIESLDAAVLIGHATIKGKDVRKVKAVEEIIKVGADGRAELNVPFRWDPRSNTFQFKRESYVFDKITRKKGISREELNREFDLRTRLLLKMYQEKISEFEEVQKVIHAYYKVPYQVLLRFGLK